MDYLNMFCHYVKCPVRLLLDKEVLGSEKYEEQLKICTEKCLHSAYEFNEWLMSNTEIGKNRE